MTHVAKAFMATGVLCLVIGIGWGIQMSATGDHALSPAHGHLNLLGFVVMAVIGLYYAVTPTAAASRWAVLHYGLTVAAVLILVPGIAMAITGAGETLAKIGSVLSLLATLLFGGIVLRFGVGTRDGLRPRATWPTEVTVDLSRFGAAPLIAFIAAKETNYGTETDGRIPGRCGADRADERAEQEASGL